MSVLPKIVVTTKTEGPFLLEWIASHRLTGCSDAGRIACQDAIVTAQFTRCACNDISFDTHFGVRDADCLGASFDNSSNETTTSLVRDSLAYTFHRDDPRGWAGVMIAYARSFELALKASSVAIAGTPGLERNMKQRIGEGPHGHPAL